MSKDYIFKKLNKCRKLEKTKQESPKHENLLAFLDSDSDDLEKARLPKDHPYSFEISDAFFTSGDAKIPFKRLNAFIDNNGVRESVGTVAFNSDSSGHSSYETEVHPNHRRKGLASAMYAHIENTLGGKMIPSSVMTPDGDSFWRGNKKDPQFGELEKGAAQRLFPYNPIKDTGDEEKDAIDAWTNDVDSSAKAEIPKLSGNALKRALHKLHSSTQVRRNPETGEREFLLHRGKTASDFYDGMLGNSFTPDFDVAQGFAVEAQGEMDSMDHDDLGVVSAWIPESKIHHVPRQIGNPEGMGTMTPEKAAKHGIFLMDSKNKGVLSGNKMPLHSEYEVIVDENYIWGDNFDKNVDKFTPLSIGRPKDNSLNQRINDRADKASSKFFQSSKIGKSDLSKAKAMPVGTIRDRQGVKYIKTANGWERYAEGSGQSPARPEYVNARQSRVANIGEDVAGSARHKAAEWAGIRAAIDSGLGDKLVTRDKLLRAEPLLLDIEKNSNRAFDDAVITMAMKKFPPKPNSQFLKAANGLENEEVAVVLKNGKLYTPRLYNRQFPGVTPDKSWTAGEIREGALNDYYNAFSKMKEAFKNLSAERKAKISPDAEIDPLNLLQDIRETARGVLHELKAENSFGQAIDGMVDYVNKTLNIRSNSSTSLVAAARDAALHIKSSEDPVEAMYNLAVSLSDGKGISDATGNKKVGPKKFKMADMYEGAAKRVGPESPTKDFNSQVDYLTKNTGMRGIQWGNSVTDSEREYHLAQTTTAFQDLTDILGLPAEMGSFNGRLALAIGARGKGKAMAHYEPDTNTINLTRANGVGSLAHEWGHFIDKIVGETHGSNSAFLSELSVYDRSSDQPVMEAMSSVVNSQTWKSLRSMVIDNMRDMNKNGYSFTNKDAQYWTSTTEMFARIFETYVDYKLKKAGRENTYLVAGNRGLFWPTDEMMAEFAPLLDNFIETFKNSEHLKKALKKSMRKRSLSSIMETLGGKRNA